MAGENPTPKPNTQKDAALDPVEVPSSYQLPKELVFIYQNVAPVFAEIEPYLKDFKDNEERVSFCTQAMKPLEQTFITMVDSMRKTKDPISLESAIRLYGAENTYDLFMASQLYQAIHKETYKWNEVTGKPVINPSEILSYASKTRSAFGENSRYSFLGYITGLVFDVLLAFNNKAGVNPKRTKDMAHEQWEEGIKVAKAGITEGKKAKGLTLEKYLVSLILLKRTGRIIFAILNKEYIDFSKGLAAKGFRSRFSHIAEFSRYGFSNNMISCLLCKFIPELKLISPGLLFYDYSFMLQDSLTRPDIFELVSLCTDVAAAGTTNSELKG